LSGSVFGIQYLYLSYSHMISISKGWLGGSIWCCVLELMLYCFQSHSSLVLVMVIRRFPLFVNKWAFFLMIFTVSWVVFMSVFGLHSVKFI
jgi:hypothetical protein